MTLQDQMAMAILRDVVQHPDKYSKPLQRVARRIENILTDDNGSTGWPATLGGWRAFLAEHADELRAIYTENE